MSKEELKELLESYRYDDQYLKEKLKEVQYYTNLAKGKDLPEFLQLARSPEEIAIKRIFEKKNYIESILQTLKQPYRTIMYMKYITFLTFDQIADRMNYSTKRIYQLHAEAVSTLTALTKAQDTHE